VRGEEALELQRQQRLREEPVLARPRKASLTTLQGFGQARADKFGQAGIRSIEDLADIPEDGCAALAAKLSKRAKPSQAEIDSVKAARTKALAYKEKQQRASQPPATLSTAQRGEPLIVYQSSAFVCDWLTGGCDWLTGGWVASDAWMIWFAAALPPGLVVSEPCGYWTPSSNLVQWPGVNSRLGEPASCCYRAPKPSANSSPQPGKRDQLPYHFYSNTPTANILAGDASTSTV
jgi:hypothetical protein